MVNKITYSVHPSVAYARAILENLPEKSGRPLDEWLRLIRKSGPSGEKEIREWLGKEHKVGGTTAWMIAERAVGKRAEYTDPEAYLKAAAGYVEAMYAGPRAELRSIHDALVRLGTSLGRDVKVCPCKTIVPLYRNHVFAEIKPATNSRVDFGLALRGAKGRIPKRVASTGGLEKGDRITHRIPLTSAEEIDAELKTWLKVAFDLDA